MPRRAPERASAAFAVAELRRHLSAEISNLNFAIKRVEGALAADRERRGSDTETLELTLRKTTAIERHLGLIETPKTPVFNHRKLWEG